MLGRPVCSLQKDRNCDFSGGEKERALVAISDALKAMLQDEIVNFVQQFKGRCNKCGKYGHNHKGADYQGTGTNTTKSSYSFGGKCYGCDH